MNGDNFAYPNPFGSDCLSKRELIAAMALQGLVSCQDFVNEVSTQSASKQEAREKIAFWAVTQADALIAELSKDQSK